MAEQVAIALIDGKLSQIPIGDTIRGAGSLTNIDGGLAASVYLTTQILDSGGA